MPSIDFAVQVIEVVSIGRVVRFPSCEPRFLQLDDPYYEPLCMLQEGGLHRNVYCVDSADLPVWRISDFAQFAPDHVTGIEGNDQFDECIVATTFQGQILEVDLRTGHASRIGFTKA
ncbi:MAG: hypothetical protein CMJ58_22485 [Planctomycetaceae bacterium]|nr:hypothetical protein [Planctomycetaceae bacterium]